MCGIFGFTGKQDSAALHRMANAVLHRGPDEFGSHETDGVSLGIRRLAIVDIVTGQQPASTQDDRIWTVLNGEIYNHIELRKELESLGHKFRSDHSDTEVIPHLYQEYGIEGIERLNGMFGIALWDSTKNELHLIRDRSGIKPLFYAIKNGQLYFGSEIKSILAHGAIPKEPDFENVANYFSFKNVPSPGTAFNGISQLRPGQRLVFRRGEVRLENWWTLQFREQERSPEAAATELRRLLTDSVRLQLRSDAPFGAYLSGGIDSSAVVALASQQLDRPLKTFTMIYDQELEGKSRDRRFAQEISKRYGTDHQEDVLRPEEISSNLPEIVEAFDEPFSGTISTFFLTRFISKYVKVALSGDGADELFGSYLNHRLAFPLADANNAFQNGSIEKWKKELPAEFEPERTLALAKSGDEASRRMRQYIFLDEQKRDLLAPLIRSRKIELQSEKILRRYYSGTESSDPLNRALYVDQMSLLPDQVLAFVDRLSMAHSVEVRPPILDHRIVEFAATVPGRQKITPGGSLKHVLKDAVRDLLPAELIDRPKEGFVMPVHLWLLKSLRPMMLDLLAPSALQRQGILSSEHVQRLLDEHIRETADHGYKLWNLMMFQLWWNRHFSSRN